jgi:aminopeptidase N
MSDINRRQALSVVGGAVLLASCGSAPKEAPVDPDAHDVHSYGQPDKVRVQSVALDLEVLFETRKLKGNAILVIDAAKGSDPLILDTRDLDIDSIEISPEGDDYGPAKYTLGTRDPILGAPLTITLEPGTKFVRVYYSSSPTASGLQWLMPEQTAGKKQPFLFSQNQSIHARSWIPIQDSPGARITYKARIRVPKGLRSVMSAEHQFANEEYADCEMKNPIPPYLIALAVGDLEFQAVGPRTGVYAEPSVLPKAAKEFEDMEKMIAAVEGLYGPYRWGRYDLLILPPSFPFGGMENPMLTFATPTVIAGDKSLVGLVSHELAHSWSGNLVTNATWRDFWLNEGFTTYIENRIQEVVYGPEQAVMEQALGWRSLQDEIKGLPASDTILHIDLKGRDPEEGTTDIPYGKGSLFVRLLEQTFGRPAIDDYLKRYFDHFAFQSITTATMLAYLKKELLDKNPQLAAKIDLQKWVYEPGLPESAPHAVSARLEDVAKDAKTFAAGSLPAREIQTAKWSTQEWLEFLEGMPPLDAKKLAELDQAFHFTKTGNSEVLDQWLEMAIKAEYAPAYPRLESFLKEVGRQKFIRPLYTALMKTPAGQVRAKAIYKVARPGYHPIAQTSVDKIVGKP